MRPLRVLSLGMSLLLLLLMWGEAPDSHANTEQVDVELKVVYADKSGKGFDESLRSISERLGQLFDYTHYRLESQARHAVGMGAETLFPLPNGRMLTIRPTGRDAEGRIQVELSVSDLVKTDFRLRDGGTLIVGGPRHESGVLVLVISFSVR